MGIEKTDVVIVGEGAVGGILAAELGKGAGMKVIGLGSADRASPPPTSTGTMNYATSSGRICAPM